MSFIVSPIRLVAVLALALPAFAMAQHRHGGDAAGAPAPSSAASAPAAQPKPQPRLGSYRSVFEGYRPFSDQPAVSWREANDAVGRIGGWRAYARETQQEAAPEAAASQPGTKPNTQGGHGAHKSQ